MQTWCGTILYGLRVSVLVDNEAYNKGLGQRDHEA